MIGEISPEREQLAIQMNLPNKNFNVEALLAAGGAMASTVLSSFTSALGITLPFAAYIGMSQAIALVHWSCGMGRASWGIAPLTESDGLAAAYSGSGLCSCES